MQRSEDDKGISLRQLADVVSDGSALVEDSYVELRDRWLDRCSGQTVAAAPSSYHAAYVRRLSPLSDIVSEGAGDRGLSRHAGRAGLRPRRRFEHPHRSRGSPAEVTTAVRDRLPTRPPSSTSSRGHREACPTTGASSTRRATRCTTPAATRSSRTRSAPCPATTRSPRSTPSSSSRSRASPAGTSITSTSRRSRRPRTPRRRSSSTPSSSVATSRSSSSSWTSGRGSPRTGARRRATPTG